MIYSSTLANSCATSSLRGLWFAIPFLSSYPAHFPGYRKRIQIGQSETETEIFCMNNNSKYSTIAKLKYALFMFDLKSVP